MMRRTLRLSPRLRLLAGVLLAGVLLAGCRGMETDNPPIHPNLNMDFQEKFQAQEYNPLFEDKAAMRKPVSGTVARGLLKEDTEFFTGRTEDGEYVERVPIAVDRALVERGRERYNIYCSVCHGQAGSGQGIIMRGNYGYTPASSYHVERLRQVTDGYLYDVVANGVRNMPGYAQQIPVRDRWAIVTYVRALQRSQNAREGDLPEGALARIQEDGANVDGEGGADAASSPAASGTAASGTAASNTAASSDAPSKEASEAEASEAEASAGEVAPDDAPDDE